MGLFLTIYKTCDWNLLVNTLGITAISEADAIIPNKHCALIHELEMPKLNTIPLMLSETNTLYIAAVQAELYIAQALEQGKPIIEAENIWKQKTTELLSFQAKDRPRIKIFNLHQALISPDAFCQCIDEQLNPFPVSSEVSNHSLELLAACQYVAQSPNLKQLNTRLQATALPLSKCEHLNLDVNAILQRGKLEISTQKERDLLLSQLQTIQEKFEMLVIENANLNKNTITEKDLLLSQLQASQEKFELHSAENATLHKSTCAERDLIKSQLSKTEKLLEEKAGLYNNCCEENNKLQNELLNVSNKLTKAIMSQTQLEQSLEDITAERDAFLLEMQKIQELLEEQNLKLQAEQQNTKHTLLARDKQHTKEIAKLDIDLRKAKAKAASAEFAGQQLQQEINQLKRSLSWKAAKPVRILSDLIRRHETNNDTLLKNAALLLSSEYFDSEWYLLTYPDVAAENANPAEHYLLHGAKEGRFPSPLFDGNWYLEQYPDVANAGENPLIHFILFGLREGRSSSPKLLVDRSQNAEPK